MTMNLPLIVAILSFIFIVSYNPKKKQQVEYYQPQPTVPIPVPMCDEARYLNIQGLTPECSGGHPKEILGAIYGR